MQIPSKESNQHWSGSSFISQFKNRTSILCYSSWPLRIFSAQQKNNTHNLVSRLLLHVYFNHIKVKEDYSTTAFILSFVRFSCEISYPKFLSVDEGSQLVKRCESMKLIYTDIKYNLHKDSAVEFDTCSIGGHNYNGKVERRICQIKEPFEKNIQNER